MFLGLAITVIGCYLLGFRGWGLLFAALAAFFPVFVITGFGIGQIFRPPMVPWKDIKPETEPDPYKSPTDLFDQ